MKYLWWSGSRSKAVSNLVIARPAGFSLCTTAILRCVVRASQARRKVRDRVLPAPKTPPTARVDLPDRRASARLEAIARPPRQNGRRFWHPTGVAILPLPEDCKTAGHRRCDRLCSLPAMLLPTGSRNARVCQAWCPSVTHSLFPPLVLLQNKQGKKARKYCSGVRANTQFTCHHADRCHVLCAGPVSGKPELPIDHGDNANNPYVIVGVH